MIQTNNLPPFFNQDSQVLILGSFPSVKSREAEFYYSNPTNKFWEILSAVFKEPIPQNKNEKVALLEKHKIALYDTAMSCDIDGSLDKNLKNAKPTDLSEIFSKASIKRVFLNGKKAEELYKRFHQEIVFKNTNQEAILLTSTSAANARLTTKEKIKEWSQIHTQG